MEKMPQINKKNEGKTWTHTFNKFSATVFVPNANESLKSDLLNYGFISPYILVFADKKFSEQESIDFSNEQGFTKLASDFASSVVFIYPTSGNWETADKTLFSEIISNSKIHQYYEDGVAKNWNRFSKNIEGYFIRGAIFRTNLYGFGKGADFIAKNCLNHFEGDGLWGKSDIAPVTCILNGLSVIPTIECKDIPVISYNNSEQANKVLKEQCTYFLEKASSNGIMDVSKDYYDFSMKFRRMTGELQMDPDLLSDGLIREPGEFTVKTSEDNNGDDKSTKEHRVGYFAFYNKGLLEKKNIPLVLGFHGGGDSCFFFSVMAGWAKICHKHDFLLVTVENHLNSTATEMQEFIQKIVAKYPVDTTRIYATGFSMGGIKTWDLVQEYPNCIAAAAPMDATVDIGENVYFAKINKPVNNSVSVPIFYAGGEVTPLPELPFQEQKCINRMKYALEINKANAAAKYNVKLEEKDSWENKIWGINGDFEYKDYDKSRDATLTLQIFKNEQGKFYNVFGSISGQGHDCREHTCEHAWKYMSQFSRDKNGTLHGGDTNIFN